jgi:hypothetical protein
MAFEFDSNRPDLMSALALIVPNGRFVLKMKPGESEAVFEDVEWQHLDQFPDWIPPTKEYVMGYLASIQDIWDRKEKHRQLRRAVYPSVGDQLDALWKGGKAAEDMKKVIDAVKQQFPANNPSHPWRGSGNGTVNHYYRKGSSVKQHPEIPLPDTTHPLVDPNAPVPYQGDPDQLSLHPLLS